MLGKKVMVGFTSIYTHHKSDTLLISHDPINHYLRREKLTPRLLWDNAKPLIQIQENAYVIFDDTIFDKRYPEDIELTRRQYSGNEHGVLRGIG